jgi:hypothetical protein
VIGVHISVLFGLAHTLWCTRWGYNFFARSFITVSVGLNSTSPSLLEIVFKFFFTESQSIDALFFYTECIIWQQICDTWNCRSKDSGVCLYFSVVRTGITSTPHRLIGMKPHESKWLAPWLPSSNEVLWRYIILGYITNEIRK